MKLEIEKWVEEIKPFDEEAMQLFNESVICYKIGAYKSAYIMSYLSFQLTIRERIRNSKYLPENMPEEQWNSHIKKLRNDDTWEEEVRNIVCISPPNNNKGSQDPKDNRIIKFTNHEEMTTEYIKWKNTRNKCVHSKKGTIDNSTVECFWNYMKDNINNFYVGGGIKALKQSIIDSFDISKSTKKYDYSIMIKHIEQIREHEKIAGILSEIDNEYMQLRDYKIEENYNEFYRMLTYSSVEEIRSALFLYLNKEDEMCIRFVRFYKEFPHFIKSILYDTAYIKSLFNEYKENFQYTDRFDKWLILRVMIENKLLTQQEYDIFYRSILKNNTIYYLSWIKDVALIELMKGTGCFNVLSDIIARINFKDFYTANDNENLIHCAIRYCDISNDLYDSVKYLIDKRGGRPLSLYDGLVEYLDTPEGKQKYKDYETVNNETFLTKYFGW